jgi:pyruvate/2-oxoglutarate/acetoin dehydrogenase E1 component
MVHKALEAAEKLEKEGISVEVVDPRTLVPFDKRSVLDSVKKTGRLVIATEGNKTCGLGAEILSIVVEEAFDYLDAPIKRVSSLSTPVPFSPPLEKYVIPDENKIIQAVKGVVA